MNILLINHYAGSAQHGMEHRPHLLAREWAKRGHHVTIAAGSFSHLRSRNPEAPGSLTREEIDGIRYVWLATPRYVASGLARVASMAVFVGQLYRRRRELMCPRPDLVIASSTYPFDVFPARSMAAASGARFVYEIHDLWPLTPMELGGYSERHPFIAAAQIGEDYGYRHADAVVSLLPGTLPYMMQHGLPADRFVWIPNGYAPEDYGNATSPAVPANDQLLGRLRGAGRFIVGYAGTVGVANALDVLLEAAKRTTAAPVDYVILGDGAERTRLARIAADAGLRNVHFLGRVPRASVARFLAQVDVAYIGWRPSRLYRYGINPNKLIDYMLAARPVLHSVTAYNDPVADSRSGISVPAGDAEAIACAVHRFSRMPPSERAEMGERGRRYAEAHYDYGMLAQRFLDFATAAPRRNV